MRNIPDLHLGDASLGGRAGRARVHKGEVRNGRGSSRRPRRRPPDAKDRRPVLAPHHSGSTIIFVHYVPLRILELCGVTVVVPDVSRRPADAIATAGRRIGTAVQVDALAGPKGAA